MKNNQRGAVLLVVLVLVLTGICTGGYLIYKSRSEESAQKTIENSPDSQLTPVVNSKEEAIKQAMEFEYDGVCAAVMTHAIHDATGAEYEFPSSCLPEGWTAKPQ